VSRPFDHDEIEALLAIRALGGASVEDVRRLAAAMTAHGACETCSTLQAETNEAAGRLPFALPPARIPAALEERVIRSATRSVPAPHRRASLVPTLVVAAAVVVAFAAGWVARGANGSAVPLDGLAGARVVSLQAGPGAMAFAYRPGEPGGLLFGSDVSAPPSGRVYELWLIRDGTPIRQGCFAPTSATGLVMLVVRGSVHGSDTVALTVESRACPSAPTTEPITATPLGTA
jgi:Anti-sigma-K factor rskA